MRNWVLHCIKRIKSQVPIRHISVSNSMSKRIAVCQMTSVAEKAANLDVVSRLVGEAAKQNAEMVFFPEACDYISPNKEDIVALAEPVMCGHTVSAYRKLALQYNVWLSMGGVHEKDESDPTKIYNTHLIINNKGEVVQGYRKLHLFDVEIPTRGVRLKETDFTHPGEHVVTPVDTPVGRVGMCICYDMRFPELSTALSSLGAELLTFPSAFTVPTGKAHWHVLLRARAIENQCYVVCAAQVGAHNHKRASYGHALVVDPWGEVVADCGPEGVMVKVVDLSMDRLCEVRTNMPVAQHRRRDMYSLYTLHLRKEVLPAHRDSKCEPRDPATATTEPHTGNEEMNVFGHVRVPETCVFYKSKLSYAFVNLRCVTPGHVLVAPLRAVERNNDLTEAEAADFFHTVRLVQRLMEKVHQTHSCTVTIQDGEDAGQTVKHLHCHIMPRKKGDFIENDHIYLELAKHDQFKSTHPTKPPRTLEEMRAEAHMLRNEMKTLVTQLNVA